MLKDPEVIKEGEFRGTPKTQSFRKPRKKTSMLKREVNGNSVVRNSSPPTLFKTIQHGNVGKQSMAPSGGTASAGASGLAPGAPSRVPSAGPSSAPSTAQPGAPSKVIGMSGGIFSTTILDEPRSLQIMNSQVAFFPKTPASTIDRWYVFASSILAFLILCVCIIATHRVSGKYRKANCLSSQSNSTRHGTHHNPVGRFQHGITLSTQLLSRTVRRPASQLGSKRK